MSVIPESSLATRVHAIEISAGILQRHLVEGARALVEKGDGGGGAVWSLRKQANSMLTQIHGQLTTLAIASKRKTKKEKRA
jgi:hypothetical protein